jgi:NAD(P)H dehydrogenase (quinone)
LFLINIVVYTPFSKSSAPLNYANYDVAATPRPVVRLYWPAMKGMVVLCHPVEGSFCHAIASEARGVLTEIGYVVEFHDLYNEGFDPVLTAAEVASRTTLDQQVQVHASELRSSDRLVVVHPDWWGGPPAMLKGWVDRVFRPGIAYDWKGEELEENSHIPLLGHVTTHVFVTSDRESHRPVVSLSAQWEEICAYSGMTLRQVRVFSSLRRSGLKKRRSYLREVAALLK